MLLKRCVVDSAPGAICLPSQGYEAEVHLQSRDMKDIHTCKQVHQSD
jgi:hypothetical protein